MIEIWKPIKDYENYEVSNLGKVKSLNYNRTGEEKILKPRKDKDGYLYVGLYKSGKRKFFKIHRLVATAYIFNPDDKPQINHIDCNRQNNCVENLEWCTIKENAQYREKMSNGKCVENAKKRNKPIIATNLKTGEEIYFESQSEASRELNLYVQYINQVLKGKQKKAGNYAFKYIEELI